MANYQQGERIKALEIRADNQDAKHTATDGVLKEVLTEIKSINKKMDRSGGFIAGMVFVVSSITGLVIFGLECAYEGISKHHESINSVNS